MRIFVLLFIIVISDVHALGGAKGPLSIKKDSLRNEKPVVLSKIGIDEHLGAQLDLMIPFKDDHGKDVVLGKYFGSKKPVFLMLIYYSCPTLCNTHLNELMGTFRDANMAIGEDYEFVAVSIDPDESFKLAAQKKESYLKEYGKPESREGWHFLTGDEDNIKKLAKQVGFKYAWDQQQRQWAHAAAAYVVTPTGVLSYYHYGVSIQPKVLRLSLVEAADHKIGNIVDRLVLFCLQYDPDRKTYAFYAFNIMRVGAFLMAIFLVVFLIRFWKKENKTQIEG